MAQFYYFAPFDIVLSFTFLSTFVPELQQKETGKTVFNFGSYIYYTMISEMDTMLLNGTLKIVCPVCDVLLRMPLPGEKTLQKLRGYTTLTLDFWEMFQLLREHHQYRLISRYMLLLSKLKQNYQSKQTKIFKELECILQGKLITARLNVFLLISREAGPLLKIYQAEKPLTAFMCYDLSSDQEYHVQKKTLLKQID